MQTLLHERIFGQDEAVHTILSAFKAHDKKKPLTFHFAGDNGVGKSFTAKTIAEALFQYGNPNSGDFRGFLYLRGEQYQGLEQAEEYRQSITRRIVEQLIECPNSLIVFDEVEYLASPTVSAISGFLDDSIPTFEYDAKVKCRTNEATFIVISDFGTEGRTDKMSFQDVKALVERDSKEFWANPKQPSVITHVIPFMPLNARARAQTAQYQLARLAKLDLFAGRSVRALEFAPGGADAVAQLSNEVYPAQNGRGVTKYVESYLLPLVLNALDSHEVKQKARRAVEEERRRADGADRGDGGDGGKKGKKVEKEEVAVHVTARQPLTAHSSAPFEVVVETTKVEPKKESWWRKAFKEEL